MATQKDNELHITRIYDAPVKLVWDAWNEPEQVAKWWGPRGFWITHHSKDLRPGGHWSYTMHGPDGATWPTRTKYLEVEPLRKLVYDHGGNDDRPPIFRVTVLFEEIDGKTKMDMTMALATPDAARETAKFIKKVGGNTTWDRLAEYLDEKTSSKEVFIINRSFDAPINLMYEMWTDPKHFSKWLPPGGTMEFLRADVRKGGSSWFAITGHHDKKMYGRAEYIELRRPDLVVYAQQFCDENEKVCRHPLSPTWPLTMLTTVRLFAEGPDATRVMLTWEPINGATREEIETFVKGRAGMTMGWTGSFDNLETYLSKLE